MAGSVPAKLLIAALIVGGLWISPQAATDFTVGDLEPVPVIRQRRDWNRFTIFVWQFETDVVRDEPLYKQIGLHAFHIDRGEGQEDLVRFSVQQHFPYYVDHAAGKGILYLSNNVRSQVTGKRSLLVRPRSLADPDTIAELKELLRANVSATKNGLVYAYAFDDEISLGSFNSPAEVDVHPLSIAWYRKWLSAKYGTIDKLNSSWGSAYSSFNDIQPVSFDEVRRSASAPPLSSWNLSSWMEWRHFMDYQFAQVLADLTRFTNRLDPRIPAGFVGGQQPSAYGGYNYALLSRAVQWMEGSSEFLRSFWNRPRRPRVLTFHLSGSRRKDTWELWSRLAHGDQGAIAWPAGWFQKDPETGRRAATKELRDLAPVFREIQGPVSAFIVNPNTYLETDPIGIYYSHPSIQAGWVMDSITHGGSWPNRYSSLEDENSSSARLRTSWCRLLEDLGYQYDLISYLDVEQKRTDLNRYKVIVLPKTVCLSNNEAAALRAFVNAGGTLIADNLTGLLTENGRGRGSGVLDSVFGITRDESKGYLDGESLSEIDAEYGKRPYPDRLRSYKGSLHKGSMVVFERGTPVLARKGRAVYLNLTPLAYEYSDYRDGEVGREWRNLIGNELRTAGLEPRVTADSPHVESLLWRNADHYVLALVKNKESEIAKDVSPIHVRFAFLATNIRNLRTGKLFGNAAEFTDTFNPTEGNFYSFSRAK
jgi:hypothetical protein